MLWTMVLDQVIIKVGGLENTGKTMENGKIFLETLGNLLENAWKRRGKGWKIDGK